MIRWSKSSPPRCVSPLVDLTSKIALADLEHRDVEGAAAQVVDGDGLVALLVEPVGQRCRGRLVDDPQHVEAGDLAGVLASPAAGVVEVRRNRDHRLGRPSRPDKPRRPSSASAGSSPRSPAASSCDRPSGRAASPFGAFDDLVRHHL